MLCDYICRADGPSFAASGVCILRGEASLSPALQRGPRSPSFPENSCWRMCVCTSREGHRPAGPSGAQRSCGRPEHRLGRVPSRVSRLRGLLLGNPARVAGDTGQQRSCRSRGLCVAPANPQPGLLPARGPELWPSLSQAAGGRVSPSRLPASFRESRVGLATRVPALRAWRVSWPGPRAQKPRTCAPAGVRRPPLGPPGSYSWKHEREWRPYTPLLITPRLNSTHFGQK